MSLIPSSALISRDADDRNLPALAGRAVATLLPPGSQPPADALPPGQVICFDALEALIEAIAEKDRPIVLIHGDALAEHDLELASSIPDLPGHPALAVLGDEENLAQALNTARRLGLGCCFPSDCVASPLEFDRWIGWLDRQGPEPGLAPHLEPGTEISEVPVRAKGDKGAAIDDVLEFVRKIRPDDTAFHFDIRLILEEKLNNALFHAFLIDDGREKYSIDTFTQLQAGEDVLLTYGADSSQIGISVSDNQGQLRRDKVLATLDRQMSVKGLLDENGRGLYLTYSLAGRLIFNLTPGRRTELITLYPAADPSGNERSSPRPILIFERS